MKNNIAIQLSNVSKRYFLHPEKPTLVENLNPFYKQQEFWALKDINITIKKGEHVGLIGANGAGKTTLLRIISKISQPTSGKISTIGKVVSLIELRAGFEPELTGVNNIYINGMLLGIPKTIIDKKLKSIINYADIGNFIYQPTHTFSDGMLLRLGFSIVVATNPDILIFDENLFVGDKSFSKKIHKTIQKWTTQSKTLILSSHNLFFVEKYCKRGILLSKGIIQQDDNIHTIIQNYVKDMPNQSIIKLYDGT